MKTINEIAQDMIANQLAARERMIFEAIVHFGDHNAPPLTIDGLNNAIQISKERNHNPDTIVTDQESAIKLLDEIGINYDKDQSHQEFNIQGLRLIVSEKTIGYILVNSDKVQEQIAIEDELRDSILMHPIHSTAR